MNNEVAYMWGDPIFGILDQISFITTRSTIILLIFNLVLYFIEKKKYKIKESIIYVVLIILFAIINIVVENISIWHPLTYTYMGITYSVDGGATPTTYIELFVKYGLLIITAIIQLIIFIKLIINIVKNKKKEEP